MKRFMKEDHLGHTILFVSPKQEELQTAFGESEAAVCSAVICATCRQGWDDVPVFGSALAPRLFMSLESVIVGVLVQGTAKPGRNAPWLLDDPSEEDLALARQIVDEVAVVSKGGKVLVDFDALDKDTKSADDEPEF
jgi:hypothetical protein